MQRTKIAVNTRLLIKGKLEGIGRFAHESLQRIVLAHPEVDFYFLFDRAPDDYFIYADNVKPVVLGPQARHPFLFILWFDWSVKNWINKNRPDLFLSPDGYLSLNARVNSLPVIHDLNFEHYPEGIPRISRWYYRTFFPKFAALAKRIVTVSEYSSKDIQKVYEIPKDDIDVVFNGVSDEFWQEEKRENWVNNVVGGEYILHVGSLHKRKNIEGCIAVYKAYRQQGGTSKLLFLGAPMWRGHGYDQLCEASGFGTDIHFQGRVSNDELAAAYQHANCLLYLSLFEGFGIPLVEAMASSCPVVCSNTTSLPEVAGDAALLVNPLDAEETATAVLKMEQNAEFRAKKILEGKAQAAKFTWDNTAAKLWASIEKLL